MAATKIGRAVRGKQCRRALWSVAPPGGALAVRAARRAQRHWRGYIGRKEGRRRALAALALHASYIAALFRGNRARRAARAVRAAAAQAATRKVQRCYRGRLARRAWKIWKEERRSRARAKMQRCWRGALGRRKALNFGDALREGARRLEDIAAVCRRARARKQRGKLQEPPAEDWIDSEGSPRPWTTVDDAIGRATARAAESDVPSVLEIQHVLGPHPPEVATRRRRFDEPRRRRGRAPSGLDVRRAAATPRARAASTRHSTSRGDARAVRTRGQV